MGLETGNYLADFVPTNPAPSDQKSLGDDHLRLLKRGLRNSFVGFPGTVLAGGTDTGAANAYVLAPTTPLLAYSVNMVVLWIPANTNGGASTINISGLGAQQLLRIDGTALANGDIMTGQPIAMLYTGTAFRFLSVTKQYIDQLILSGVLPGQTGNAGKPLITDGTNATFSNAFGVAMDEAKGANIAAATSINLNSAAGTGNYTHITGSGVSIAAMTLPAGAERTLTIDAINTLVNGANLILPGGANITTAAGDTLTVRGEGSGVARVIAYTKKSGRAVVEQTSPGLTLLATVTPTAVAAIDFLNTFSATYDDYLIIAEGLSSSVVDQIAIRVARSGVVDTGNNYGSAVVNSSSGGTNTAVPTQINTTGNASLALRIEILGANASLATSYQHILTTGVAGSTGATFFASAVNGVHGNGGVAGALTGFRLFWQSGANFGSTGKIRVYGYKGA